MKEEGSASWNSFKPPLVYKLSFYNNFLISRFRLNKLADNRSKTLYHLCIAAHLNISNKSLSGNKQLSIPPISEELRIIFRIKLIAVF